jgi:hypothetical protein
MAGMVRIMDDLRQDYVTALECADSVLMLAFTVGDKVDIAKESLIIKKVLDHLDGREVYEC